MSLASKYLLGQFYSVSAFCELINGFCDRGPGLEALIDKHIDKYGNIVGKDEGKRNRLLLGELSSKDIPFLLLEMSERIGGKRITNNTIFIRAVIDRLREHFLMVDSTVPGLPDYKINKDRFPVFRDFGLLEHAIFGPAYSIDRMRRSIPSIEVTKSDGSLGIGTGFVVCTIAEKGTTQHYVVTNRHVVEAATITRIMAHDVDYERAGREILCDYADLALLPIKSEDTAQSFLLNSEPSTLEDVIALGYPAVARTRAPVLLAHKGEVNGEVETYDGEKLQVVSCHVNPGNSGGPLMDSIGRCCGVITQSHSSVFEASTVSGGLAVATYNMAIPANVVEKFVMENSPGSFGAQPSVLINPLFTTTHNGALNPST